MECSRNGVLGRDGYVYVVTKDGRVLKIDTSNNSHCIVVNTVESYHSGSGWGLGILGIDGCIYWPPFSAAQILKYDPYSNLTSLVGDDFGYGTRMKWKGGCAVHDGVV